MPIRSTAARLLSVLAMIALPGATPAPPMREEARFAWVAYQGHDPALARAPTAREYANPILAGFYPDPSIVRVGDSFYLVHSTFSYFPGLPIIRSRDLVHWTQIGNAIDRPGMVSFRGIGLSRGLFAPAISWHAGLFYIVNTCVDCGGNFVITARDPAGPWSDPVWLKGVGGIDPSLFIDADGAAWLMNNDEPKGGSTYPGHRAIWIRRFDLTRLRTVGPAVMIVNGGVDIASKPIWAEGPHIFRYEGKLYLTTAEGGTAEGHSEVVYRGERPEGPWTPLRQPILTQRDLDPKRPNPITSAGHAQLVETPRGDWWATFLAVRLYGDDLYNTGRETFLLPVTWRDGWPVITEPGQAVARLARRPDLPPGRSPRPTGGDFGWRESFAGARLGPNWLMVGAPARHWWRTGAGLTIEARRARIGDAGQPSFLGVRQQHPNAQATTELRFASRTEGAKAGLVAFQDDAHYYFVGLVRAGGRAVLRVERRASASDPVDGVVLASRPLTAGGPVRLRITARGGAYDFAYAGAQGGWTPLLTGADGSVLSTKVAGGFVGATLGPYASSPGGGE